MTIFCEVFNVIIWVEAVEFLCELVKLVYKLNVSVVLECYFVFVEFAFKKQTMNKVQGSKSLLRTQLCQIGFV